MEDVLLFLRDNTGSWIFLERTVSFILTDLKIKKKEEVVVGGSNRNFSSLASFLVDNKGVKASRRSINRSK